MTRDVPVRTDGTGTHQARARATATGFVAVLLWSLLGLFTVATTPVPPLLLNAMTFGIGGLVGLCWAAATGGLCALRRVDWRVCAFGTAGLFGYHFLYFSALRLAPPAQAGLIAYLWPLLIVLLSGLLPGERLTRGHLAGAGLAFGGAALVVAGSAGGVAGPTALAGYGLAALCAVTWAVYSVVSRRLAAVPTQSVALFCVGTAALSGIAHPMFEQTVWPDGVTGWLAVGALGLGPVGVAFYVWDIGIKRGDIQMLGVAAYAAPLMSTIALVAAGMAPATPVITVAAVMIAAGAALAARASATRITPATGA